MKMMMMLLLMGIANDIATTIDVTIVELFR